MRKISFKALRSLHLDVNQTIGYYVYQWIVPLFDIIPVEPTTFKVNLLLPSHALSQLWPSRSKSSKLKVRLPCMNSMTLMRLEEACTNKSKNCYHAFGSTIKTCRRTIQASTTLSAVLFPEFRFEGGCILKKRCIQVCLECKWNLISFK